MGDDKKLCIVCKEKIHVDAKKCIQCESFQNWRRLLPFGSTVLSLLIALISVIGLVFPAIYENIQNKSNVKVEHIQLEMFKFNRRESNDLSLEDIIISFEYSPLAKRTYSKEEVIHPLVFNFSAKILVTNSMNKPGAITSVDVKLFDNDFIHDTINYHFESSEAIIEPNSYEFKEILSSISYPVSLDSSNIVNLNEQLIKEIEKSKIQFKFTIRQNGGKVTTTTTILDVSGVKLF